MARSVALFSKDDERVLKYWNVDVDICGSHTVIYRDHENVRFCDEIDCIKLAQRKTVVFFKSGWYLVVIR